MRTKIDFTGALTLRIYDSILTDKLSDIFRKNRLHYESANHFLSELIVRGLEQNQYDDKMLETMQNTDNALTEKLANLSKEHKALSETVYLLIKQLTNIQKLACATYRICEAQNDYNNGIPQTELDSGVHDCLPRRFWLKNAIEAVKMYENQNNV